MKHYITVDGGTTTTRVTLTEDENPLQTLRIPLGARAGITDPQAFFKTVVWYLVAFNLIKTTSISVLTLLLYKRLSNFIKGLRFDGGRYKAKGETPKQEEENE